MICPSDKCGSSNVQHLPHYWESLSGDSPLKKRYASPGEGDRRARLIAVVATFAGLALACTGTIGMGLVVLVAGAIGSWVTHGQIMSAEAARAAWQRQQICLACTHLWEP